MKELRQHPRYPARWSCIIRQDSLPNRAYHGHTHDISEAGAAILSDHNLSPGGHCTLLLAPPPTPGRHTPVIEIRCRLAYSVHSDRHRCFRHGIEFVSFQGAGKVLLAQILGEHFPGDALRLA